MGSRLGLALIALVMAVSRPSYVFGQQPPFPSGTCPTPASTAPVTVSPFTFNPIPNTFCFALQGRGCGDDNACRVKQYVLKFQLLSVSKCARAVLTATLDNVPVPRVTVIPAEDSPAYPRNSTIITVPGLNLTAVAVEGTTTQLCLSFPAASNCSTLAQAAVGGAAKWEAALMAADRSTCPVFIGKKAPPAPKGSCQSCFVWDMLGKARTQASSSFNFFTRNSCGLVAGDAENFGQYDNCCQFAAKYALSGLFDKYRADGTILDGFDFNQGAFCNRTSLRVCGTLRSSKAAKAMLADLDADGYFGSISYAPYDITDDMCPMALADNAVRMYTAKVGSDQYDKSCMPYKYELPHVCPSPNKTYVAEINGIKPFPNSDCDDTPGITPFVVDPYEEVLRNGTYDYYCVNIATAAPKARKTPCGNVSRLDRVSFWLMENDPEGPERDYPGVILQTLQGGQYVSRALNVTWGPKGNNEMIVSSLGLDAATVPTLKPRICFKRPANWHIGTDSPDGLNFLWSALNDDSGKCCPTFYSNIY